MNLDAFLNFLIPAILLLIALGFVYTKFLKPWVVPHLIQLWEYIQNSNQQREGMVGKELAYE